MTVQFPAKANFLFEPARYKVLHGGRGSTKSWSVARALLIRGAAEPLRILCGREYQNSIKDSSHLLLKNQAVALGIAGFYDATRDSIVGANGTEFIFSGLKYNIDNVRSKEDIDIAWIEEAKNVSKTSWDTLIPTIRKPNSEIWITFNPELETDETYKRFKTTPPTNSVVREMNWSDNPWFPDVLRQEMIDLRNRDYDAYLNVWEGKCLQTLEGAIFANELRKAVEEGRITKVPYDPTKPVHTFWDLGWSDETSIWFAQAMGFQYNVIDFHQDRQRTVEHYLKLFASKGYQYGTDYLPHDAKSGTLASSGRGVDALLRAAGRKVVVMERVPAKAVGINASRTIFASCWFDEVKCADGLQHLRHYKYEVDPDTRQFSKMPMHDEHSHAADGFQTLGLSITNKTTGHAKPNTPPRGPVPESGHNWMSH